jgi:hypothetical protein
MAAADVEWCEGLTSGQASQLSVLLDQLTARGHS